MSRFLAARQAQMGPPPDPAYCAESNEHEILGTTGAMMSVACLICGMRLAVRAFMLKSVGSDDYVMLLALLMAIGTFVCFVGESDYGSGRHWICTTPAQSLMFAQWQYAHSLLVMWGVILVKISIALFLMRLVPPGKQWKRLLWAVIVFLIAFMLACSGTLIFQCWPVRAAWDYSIRATANCFSNTTFRNIGLTNSSINCATDFLLAALPIPIIIKLQVNTRTKISLVLILSLGYFACAAGIVKAVKQANFFNETDPLWHNSFNVWNMIELCVGIVAGSLPSLRPLFAKILTSGKSMFSGGSWPSSNERTIGSSGYKKHRNRNRDPNAVPSDDVPLSDVKNTSDMTTSTATANSEFDRKYRDNTHLEGDRAVHKPYTVRVTSGQDQGDDGSWDEIEPVRNRSEERLTHPSAIFKTTQVTSMSEKRYNSG